MTFDELIDEACQSVQLPNMARILLPSALSEATKRTVMSLDAATLGSILKNAIDQIDRGSVESVDVLVRKALR